MAEASARARAIALGALAFSAAFLLFAVQPLLAKWLLPALGGSPGTWAACSVFFQGTLVLGYAVAHAMSRVALARRFGPPALALAALGGVLASGSLPEIPHTPEDPARFVLGLLVRQVGAAFLMLATLAPTLSRWAVARAGAGAYRLYAVSNAGSLVALLGYPIVLEPLLALPRQWALWSAGCAFVSLALVLLAVYEARAPVVVSDAPEVIARDDRDAPARPGASERLYWLAVSAVPSALSLATTSYLTLDIAAVPLLWVLPLALYLITFIVAFAGAGDRTRSVARVVFVVASLGTGWNALDQGSAPLWRQLGFALATLGSGALLCHLELARSRPAPARLTEYYLWSALGGALGAVLVGLVAPLCLNDHYELELSVLASYALLLARPRVSVTPLLLEPGRGDLSPLPAFEAERRLMQKLAARSPGRLLLMLGLGLCVPMLLGSLWFRAHGGSGEGRVLERRRSLLGALRVTQLQVGRVLTHGRIRHGLQLSGPGRRAPVMYYGPGTALAQVFAQHHVERPRRIGVIGLGVGTIAAYGRAGDVVRFYELDPNVRALAERWFSYLRDSPAAIEIQLGDGRLSLAREAAQAFDVFVLDAFASDAVPVHLLTREAFGLYLSHLTGDGVVLVNVANRHLALERVVLGAASWAQLACVVVESEADPKRYTSRVRWAVLARQRSQLASLLGGINPVATPLREVAWTDAHASLWPLLR